MEGMQLSTDAQHTDWRHFKMGPFSSALWEKAYHALCSADQSIIPSGFTTKPEDLITEIEEYVTRSKGKPIKMPNGENLFVRDVLQKVSRWIKKFVEVGDVAVQYDAGHAALPWALLRLVLQVRSSVDEILEQSTDRTRQASMNNVEKHAAVLEGVEQISYFLVWSRIEEAYLAIPFDAHAQLELNFVQIYNAILAFAAKALQFLGSKSHRIATAFCSSGSKFGKEIERMVYNKKSIESYVQQISNQTSRNQLTEILTIKDRLADLHEPLIRMEQIIHSTSATANRAETEQVLDWASRIPFQKHHKALQGKALEGTGSWLFQDPVFLDWQSSSRSQIFWLHGSVGSGKSILISMLIQSLMKSHKEKQGPYPIFFYCLRNTAEPERADPEQILRSLLRQASSLPGGPPLHSALRKRYDERRVEGDLSAEEASDIFISTIEDRPATYILVDALDECDSQKRDILLDAMETILSHSRSLVKIFVTSRDNHPDIVRSMEGSPELRVNASRNQADVIHYVQSSVQLAIDKKKLLPTEQMTADLQQTIVESLCRNADGMFRWVELQISLLCTLKKRSILLQRLKGLSPGLEKIYEELYEYKMQELGEEQMEVVKKILAWLLVAQIPMCTSSLCRLVCAPHDSDMSVETVLDLTSDLVRLDTDQDQFRFSHLSVREFLEKRGFTPMRVHTIAACACLDSLMRADPRENRYAALYWLVHAEAAIQHGAESLIEQRLEEFLMTPSKAFSGWRDAYLPLPGKTPDPMRWADVFTAKIFRTITRHGSALLLAACYNMPTLLGKIISNTTPPIDIESKNYFGESALYLASYYGVTDRVRVLLEGGANIDSHGGYHGNALQIALRRGHHETAKLLLAAGADVNPKANRFGEGALHIAAVGGHQEMVKLLLTAGAAVNVQEGRQHDKNALCGASRKGKCEVVKLLLGAGAEPNDFERDALGNAINALCAASAEGHRNVVKLLLDAGAVVDAQSQTEAGIHVNALCVASSRGYEDIMRVLLEAGADVNARSSGWGSALEIALEEHHEGAIKILLDAGADINIREGGQRGMT